MTVASQDVTALDLPARAKALVPLLGECAAAAEEQGALTDEVVEALHENGLFGMWVPRSLGGSELDPIQSLQVIEWLSYGDPSVGWVLMAAALATGTGGAYLGDSAVEELYGGERCPVITGQGTRPGSAVSEDGGFLLSGGWSFGSGLLHSSHIHSLAMIEGTGEPRIFVVPIEKATLLGNWDVLGLRATGSIDYSMDSVFVPEAFTHFATSESTKRGGVYGLGIIGFGMICHSGWALGIGRRLLDELATLAQSKAGRPGAQAERDSFQETYGKAEGTYRAARAFVYETWNDVMETLKRGDRLSVRQHTLIRLATTHATWSAHDVAQFVYTASGTTALRAGVLQRLFRDMHAGTQHVTSSSPVIQNCGRELAGLADEKSWRFLDLVDGA